MPSSFSMPIDFLVSNITKPFLTAGRSILNVPDDATKLGRPTGFSINIREVYVSAGAGFVVAITGAIMTMPGLPKKPAAERIDVDDNGVTVGLF